HAATLCLGLILLAASRPYEGFWFSIPFAIAALVRMVREKAWKPALAGTAVLLAGAAALAYFNWRVTRSPFEFPEQATKKQYAVVSDLLGIKPRPVPEYRHEVMRHFYVEEEPGFGIDVHSVGDFARLLFQKCEVFA